MLLRKLLVPGVCKDLIAVCCITSKISMKVYELKNEKLKTLLSYKEGRKDSKLSLIAKACGA